MTNSTNLDSFSWEFYQKKKQQPKKPIKKLPKNGKKRKKRKEKQESRTEPLGNRIGINRVRTRLDLLRWWCGRRLLLLMMTWLYIILVSNLHQILGVLSVVAALSINARVRKSGIDVSQFLESEFSVFCNFFLPCNAII